MFLHVSIVSRKISKMAIVGAWPVGLLSAVEIAKLGIFGVRIEGSDPSDF